MIEDANWNKDQENGLKLTISMLQEELLEIVARQHLSASLRELRESEPFKRYMQSLANLERDLVELLIRTDDYDPHHSGKLRGRIKALRQITRTSVLSQEEIVGLNQRAEGLRAKIEELQSLLK